MYQRPAGGSRAVCNDGPVGAVSPGAAGGVGSGVGSVTCCRPSGSAHMQQGDSRWKLDAAYRIPLVWGQGIRIHRRKQDTRRVGVCTRLPPGALVSRLRAIVQEMGLRKDARYSTRSKPGRTGRTVLQAEQARTGRTALQAEQARTGRTVLQAERAGSPRPALRSCFPEDSSR